MNNAQEGKSPRRSTNVSLDPAHLEEAREIGINVSQACERGLVQTIAEERAARWKKASREALESSNAWVEANALPLAKHRLF